MARIKNEQKYPIKHIPIVTDTVIGTNSQDGGKTVQFLLESVSGDSNSILQNNRFKRIKLGVLEGTESNTQLIADVINSLNPSVEVVSDEIPLFGILLNDPDNTPYFYRIGIEGKGKGVYGVGGNITVDEGDIIIVGKYLPDNFTPSEDDPNAVVVDLGEVVDGNFADAINNSTDTYNITSGTNYYFEGTVGGERILYGFQGANGIYGNGGDDIIESDLFLIYDEANPIVTESTGLEAIDEGNSTGWRLIGRNPNKYGSIGNNAVDFGFNYADNNNLGATGSRAINFGEDALVSGYGAFSATGYLNQATGTYSFVTGYDNRVSGYASTAFGVFHRETAPTGYTFVSGNGNAIGLNAGFAAGAALLKVGGVGTAILGAANADVTGANNGTEATQPLLIVGNGTHTTPNGSAWTATTRSNLLVGRRNGEFTLPSTTTAVIDAESTGKQVVTREWVEAQGFGGGLSDNIYTADGQITANQDREVTFGANSSLNFIAGDMEVFMAQDSFSVDAASWGISDYNGEAGINASNGTVLEVIAYNGLTMRLGTGGTETQPTAGQVLRAVNNTGLLEWGNVQAGVLEAINEGSGIGYALAGRNAANYGNIGGGAVDFSNSNSASSTKGAVGAFAVAMGDDVTAQGSWSAAFGTGTQALGAASVAMGNFTVASADFAVAINTSTVASGRFTFAQGSESSASGEGGSAFGIHTDSLSYGEMTVGTFNAPYIIRNAQAHSPFDRAFVVGIGVDDTTRANGFIVQKDGTVYAPEMTTALIDASTDDKILANKEWVESKLAGGSPVILPQTAPPTNSATAGIVGSMRYDSSFLYVCTGSNEWKRTPLSTW